MTIDLKKFYLIDKQKLVHLLFYSGILLAYLSSMNVSFFWPIRNFYHIIVTMFVVAAMLIANSMEKSIFSRRDFVVPTIACFAILFYQLAVNETLFGAYIVLPFNLFIFFSIFRLDREELPRIATFLCKTMAILMLICIPAFLLYLLGYPLPHRNTDFNEIYFFSNYYFFMIEDGFINEIIPRFHAFFLEPGHMGTAYVLLLATQIGKWKKWYNVVLIFATLISFSLAAYGLFIIVFFLQLWMKKKNVIRKALLFIAIMAAFVGGSFVYRDGDNMLNALIVMRLEMNEAGDDIEGNNRVSEGFLAEYDNYMQSSDIFFGRDMPKNTFGNSGYRVYIYEYGIIGFILVYTFYVLAMYKAPYKRAFFAMLILSLANFWIRAYPLWFGFFIPYFIMAMQPSFYLEEKTYDTD